ncbi:hypothetical protein ACP70R_017604 [Stipagrostis hirtigluma subsp. patula]
MAPPPEAAPPEAPAARAIRATSMPPASRLHPRAAPWIHR